MIMVCEKDVSIFFTLIFLTVKLNFIRYLISEKSIQTNYFRIKWDFIAYDHLKVISQDMHKRMEYEDRKKAIGDHNQMI